MKTEQTYSESNLVSTAAPESSRPTLSVAEAETARQLARVWRDVLGLDAVGIEQNFFDLGGDSSLAVRMFSQIEKEFGVKLPLPALYEAPTVEELARILLAEISAAKSPATGTSVRNDSQPWAFANDSGIDPETETPNNLGPGISMNLMPTSTLVDTLLPIWQRVLQISSIGPDDNFFDAGGDSALALALFNEIGRVIGRELPPVMIYHAPTVSTLAAVLEESAAPKVPALVRLKPGSEAPSVFITHGLGGSVMDFYQVVKYIQTPLAIYGMQAKGIDGAEEPFERIEDMARYSLEAVKEVQPRGPYLLVGYSLGGLVVLEMARQLTANGERVALLAMLDSYPEIRYLSFMQRARLMMRLATRRATSAMKLPFPEAVSLMLRPSRRRTLTPRVSYMPPADMTITPAMQRVRQSSYLALTRYQPKSYPGKVRFVRAAVPTAFPANPSAVWRRWMTQIEVETVPGSHLEIMTTHYEHLAAAISRYVEEAHS
jgi:thioesterase domain-containing protein/acyl carrier protein